MYKAFRQFSPQVIAVTSDTSHGNMSFKIEDSKVLENRRSFLVGLGLEIKNLVMASQPHKNQVAVVDQSVAGRGAFGNDNWLAGYEALVARDNGLVLGVQTADCLPLFFFDPVKKIVAIAHAGWRSVVSNVASQTIKTMKHEFKCQGGDIQVAIGPHIQKDHFEVKQEVADKFSHYPERILVRDGKLYVNLAGVVCDQILSEGINSAKIESSEECTVCEHNYYSRRRDEVQVGGAQLSIISLL